MKVYRVQGKKFLYPTALVLSIVLSVSVFTGCQKDESNVTDILTQKQTTEGRTQITVLMKNAFSINAFEKAVEEKFPDIDIVQVGNYTTAMDPAEYEARMEHDDLTDIIMTWPLSFGEKYCEDRLLDLSSLPFTNRYNVSMLNSISKDGKLFYLPGPAQIRGIVYNKTLFQENGWTVPKNYNEFMELCKTIEASGIRAIQLGFQNPEVLDTAFIGYNYGSAFATPKDTQWILDYGQGKGKFIDHFGTSLDTFQEMVDAGIWQAEDLNVDYSDREKLFVSRQAAMIEDSVLMAKIALRLSENADEFALMPFFNPGDEGSDWARLYMVCYIGLNKHLAEPENKAKYDKVMELMDYISTAEGQEALSGDTGAMYSSLKGVAPPNVPEIQDLIPALEHGRYAIFPELGKAYSALREGLAGMVSGTHTKEQVAKMVDTVNGKRNMKSAPPEILGTAAKDFTIMDTGNFITDIMRENYGTEIALYLDGGKDGRYNSKGVTARLYGGDVTTVDIKRIMPDLKYGETGEIWKVSMTGAALLETLEYSIPIDNANTGWFYYFSGIKMCYDPTAEPGSRVKSISMADGKALAADKVYSIAITENSVTETALTSCEKTGALLTDVLTQSIRDKKTIAPPEDNRFTVPK